MASPQNTHHIYYYSIFNILYFTKTFDIDNIIIIYAQYSNTTHIYHVLIVIYSCTVPL